VETIILQGSVKNISRSSPFFIMELYNFLNNVHLHFNRIH